MESVEGFILIGGASSRMGTDKSRLLIDGETFVQRIASELREVAARVSVVASAELPEFDLPVVHDVHQQWGALGGLHAALANARADWALVVACDLPRVAASIFERLLGSGENFDAVAPIQFDGRRQPLCAAYRVAACLPKAQALIESGERKPIALLQSVRTCWLEFDQYSDLPGARDFFDNINTPQDYLRINQKANRAE